VTDPSDSLLMDPVMPTRLFGGRQKVGGTVNGGIFISVNAGKTFHAIGLKGVTVGGVALKWAADAAVRCCLCLRSLRVPGSLATGFQSGLCYRGRNQIMPRSKLIDFSTLDHFSRPGILLLLQSAPGSSHCVEILSFLAIYPFVTRKVTV
jgi:hypothetical protein